MGEASPVAKVMEITGTSPASITAIPYAVVDTALRGRTIRHPPNPGTAGAARYGR